MPNLGTKAGYVMRYKISPEIARDVAALIDQLERRLADGRRQAAGLGERIRTLRESETYEHAPVAPSVCSWMPLLLPEGAAEVPPVSAGEAAEPLGLLTEETPERRARPSRRLVNPALMPSAEQVWMLHAAEVSARQAVAARPDDELTPVLCGCDEYLFVELVALIGVVPGLAVQLRGMPAPSSCPARPSGSSGMPSLCRAAETRSPLMRSAWSSPQTVQQRRRA
ncbi:hypothetical protein C8A01DRAFT_42188 [Parachaetomium inaequale]|uniref:Uncharacterized protein n=1 Tax=Parachaetomium inaequale TaxID=2588326 RepID=A0AAN6P8D7_9PEZI|nr:hypothetical protein C8A01DRAFT_42188 [Parachaetomium inaequale]